MYECLDRRYALTLYEVAEQKGKVQQYLQDPREICNLIETDKEFYEVIKHPQISTRKKKRTFINIFKGHINEELLSFLLILIKKGRVLCLKEKLKGMERIDLERKDALDGIVKTTASLTQEEFNNLTETLKKKYNRNIMLERVIDENILGGIYIRIDNDAIGGMVRSKLDELKNLMFRTE